MPSCGLSEVKSIDTLAVSSAPRETENVAVPPNSVVTRPVAGETLMPGGISANATADTPPDTTRRETAGVDHAEQGHVGHRLAVRSPLEMEIRGLQVRHDPSAATPTSVVSNAAASPSR